MHGPTYLSSYRAGQSKLTAVKCFLMAWSCQHSCDKKVVLIRLWQLYDIALVRHELVCHVGCNGPQYR